MNIFVGINGQQQGPFTIEQINQMLASGKVSPSDLAWQNGMPAWAPLSSLPGISAAPSASAPPAGTGAPPLPNSNPYASPTAQPYQPYPVPYGGPRTSGLAITSLVLGILSLLFMAAFGVGILIGIGAAICGHLALKAIRGSDGQVQGRGLSIAGLVCGYFGVVIGILWLVFFVYLMLNFERMVESEIERGVRRTQNEAWETIDRAQKEALPTDGETEPSSDASGRVGAESEGSVEGGLGAPDEIDKP